MNRSIRNIADICNRRFAASRKVTVGKTFVHQVLQRHQYDIQILRRKLKHTTPRHVARNLIWGLDLTGKTDTNKKLHALLGISDHGSRALLHLQVLHNKTSRTLKACISEVIRTHGQPKVIRTDNEAIFTSRIFRRGLEQLGIRHQLTDPGCPWQNGRIERLFGTLKEKLDQWIVTKMNNSMLTCSFSYIGTTMCDHIKILMAEPQQKRGMALIHMQNHPSKNSGSKHGMGSWRGMN